MYTAHFGLREMPFGITPDTSFFFTSPHSQEALNTLLVAAKNGEGFIKITGEVGTGKTLLCRKFLATLGDDFVTAYIPNPYLEPRTLMMSPGFIEVTDAATTLPLNRNVVALDDEAVAFPRSLVLGRSLSHTSKRYGEPDV